VRLFERESIADTGYPLGSVLGSAQRFDLASGLVCAHGRFGGLPGLELRRHSGGFLTSAAGALSRPGPLPPVEPSWKPTTRRKNAIHNALRTTQRSSAFEKSAVDTRPLVNRCG
jgi:hypothetical protein